MQAIKKPFEMTRATRRTRQKKKQKSSVNLMEKEKHAGNVYWEDDCFTDDTEAAPTTTVSYDLDERYDGEKERSQGDEDKDQEDEEDEDEEEDDTETCSSFSLQECIEEFRARRIRRISTHSKEVPMVEESDDKDLVEQNRTNKEQEKKCKPCKNGFCYCFTSDSGDGGCSVTGTIPPLSATSMARAGHMRRSKKPDTQQFVKSSQRRRSAPASLTKDFSHSGKPKVADSLHEVRIEKLPTSSLPLTAISRLETSSNDAPLIHIIQELHENCVISEVRVNKHKVEAHQRKFPSETPKIVELVSTEEENSKPSLQEAIEDIIKSHPNSKSSPRKDKKNGQQKYQPTAPVLETIKEHDSSANDVGDLKSQSFDLGCLQAKGPRRRHKHGGRLLEKRLSYSGVEYKQPDVKKPPRKPPRLNSDDRNMISSSESTTPSLRKAEKIIDEFLQERGITLPKHLQNKETKDKDKLAEKPKNLSNGLRKSYPITENLPSNKVKKSLRTYPSLSDIEELMDSKKLTNYEKNIRNEICKEKPIKELSFGWATPKLAEMLQCDTATGNRKEFKSQAIQAGPQTIGWKMPVQLSLDTVDGGAVEEQRNLATNMDKKITPVKSPQKNKNHNSSQAFIWGEQMSMNYSNNSGDLNTTQQTAQVPPPRPPPPKKSNLKNSSCSFLKSSKKKILRLVTPKKDNKPPTQFFVRKTPLRSIAVQTSREDLHTPPGSYHSANPTLNSLRNSSENALESLGGSYRSPSPKTSQDDFDFSRVIRSPPKKTTSKLTQRRLNFPLNCGSGTCISKNDNSSSNGTQQRTKPTYQSYNSELEQDLTLSKMNYVLNNIRARLEASDDRAVRTFQEVERREQHREMSFDCPDSFQINLPVPREKRSIFHQPQDIEPIYSEIEEDSIHISSSPYFDNKTEPKSSDSNSPAKELPRSGIRNGPNAEIKEETHKVEEEGKEGKKKVPNEMESLVADPEVLYAKVNKKTKKPKPKPKPIPSGVSTTSTEPGFNLPIPPISPMAITPLGRLLHESLMNRKAKLAASSDLLSSSEQSASAISYGSPCTEKFVGSASISSSLPQNGKQNVSQSLNNIRVQEHNSPPKTNRNLSKSDLSLYKSEIFLENLYRSEIVLNEEDNQLKENPDFSNISYQSFGDSLQSLPTPIVLNQDVSVSGTNGEGDENDSVSYELPPPDPGYDDIDGYTNPSSTNASQIIFSTPQKINQSTPKKTQTFTTKLQNLGKRKNSSKTSLNQSESKGDFENLPKTLNRDAEQSYSSRLNEVPNYEDVPQPGVRLPSNDTDNNNSLLKYKSLKKVLRQSFRKSKEFVTKETKRLSQSLSVPTSGSLLKSSSSFQEKHHSSEAPIYVAASSLYLEQLFTMNETLPLEQQLVQAVSLCRQIPNLEISPEMVEAERLLLFSTLKGNKRRHLSSLKIGKGQSLKRFYIDEMKLPVKADPSQDIFFNYFYIVTFECGGIIKSSQSVECENGEAFFKDCGLEFECLSDHHNADNNNNSNNDNDHDDKEEDDIRCDIFMLRLRKVSTLSLEPPKKLKLTKPSPSSSNGSSADIVSRFRPHASFSLKDSHFVPYEYVEKASKDSDKLCLRTSNFYSIPIIPKTKTTNLSNQIYLKARAEIRLPKLKHEGFLNVEEPSTQHNWNRRWCTLDGLMLHIWQDSQANQPLLSLDLRFSSQTRPLAMAPRELCARPRAFCLQSPLTKAGEETSETAAIFFSAETNQDLNEWLLQINTILDFVASWMT